MGGRFSVYKQVLNSNMFRKLYAYSAIAFMFVTPLSIALTNILFGVMLLLLLLSFTDRQAPVDLTAIKKGLKSKYFYSSVFVFAVFMYSSFRGGSSASTFEVGIRNISFIFFPLFFLRYLRLFQSKIKYIYLAFIFGNLAAALAAGGNALYTYIMTETSLKIAFFYRDFSIFRHPGFFANYLSIAILFVYSLFINKSEKLSKIESGLMVLSSVVFIATVYLLSSRAGFLIFATALIMIFVHGSMYLNNYRFKIIGLIALALFISLVAVNPRYYKISNTVDTALYQEETDISEDSDPRIVLWKSAVSVISNHYLLGVGAKQVRETLYEEHKIEEFKSFCTHNQILNLSVAAGIMGFLSLLLYFFFIFAIALKERKNELFMSGIIIFMGLQSEALLENAAGSFFIPFVFAMQIYAIQKKNDQKQGLSKTGD